MNAQLSDNLRYLKGLDGAVAIQDALGVTVNTNAAGGVTITQSNAGTSAFGSVYLTNDGATIGGLIRNSIANTSYGGANALNMLTFSAHPLALGTNNTIRALIDSSGNMGIGTTSPLAKLHVATATGVGMLVVSAAAVTTLQTIAPAGTVTKGAGIFVADFNNTTLLNGSFLLSVSLSGSTPYTNNDTITVAVTAGGAITVQRTTGTNGTHDIRMVVLPC